MATTQRREPDELAQGDTLAFTKSLGDYPASAGWSLVYEMRGQGQDIEFSSTASGDDHVLGVAAVATAQWLPGGYVLAGYAVNTTGERHQIYEAPFVVGQNLQGAPGEIEVKTFAQKMIEQIETAMLAKAGDDLAASQVGDSRFQLLTPEQLRTEHGYWKQVRANEVALQRAKEGKPTGMKIKPRVNVMSTGPLIGMQIWRGGYGGW